MLGRVLLVGLMLLPLLAGAQPVTIDDTVDDGFIRIYQPPTDDELAQFEVAVEMFNECLHRGKATEGCPMPERPTGQWTKVAKPVPNPGPPCWRPLDLIDICPQLDRYKCRLPARDRVPATILCTREDPNRTTFNPQTEPEPEVEPPQPPEPPTEPPTEPPSYERHKW